MRPCAGSRSRFGFVAVVVRLVERSSVVESEREITQLLREHAEGDPEALDRLVPLVYAELRTIAHWQLRSGQDREELHTTALVNELYLRLVKEPAVDWQGRAHFFAIAARAMRRIIVDFARRRCAQKRGGGKRPEPLAAERQAVQEEAETIVAINDALERIADVDDRLASVVECRFFVGMTDKETAEVLGVNVRTVQRDWVRARAWLNSELS